MGAQAGPACTERRRGAGRPNEVGGPRGWHPGRGPVRGGHAHGGTARPPPARPERRVIPPDRTTTPTSKSLPRWAAGHSSRTQRTPCPLWPWPGVLLGTLVWRVVLLESRLSPGLILKEGGAGRNCLLAQRHPSTTTTTGLWKAGWGACNREALAGAHWAEGEPASSGNLGGGGAPDVLHMLGPGSRQRNVAAERCQERPWGRACNPPRSKDPDLPGRGSQRSRPPLPLPPSPSGKPPHPVAETPRHSLCSRSHSADVCRDPSEDQAPQTACTVSEGSVWGGPAAGPGRGASQGTADTQQVQDPGLRRSPVQGAGVSRALTA